MSCIKRLARAGLVAVVGGATLPCQGVGTRVPLMPGGVPVTELEAAPLVVELRLVRREVVQFEPFFVEITVRSTSNVEQFVGIDGCLRVEPIGAAGLAPSRPGSRPMDRTRLNDGPRGEAYPLAPHRARVFELACTDPLALVRPGPARVRAEVACAPARQEARVLHAMSAWREFTIVAHAGNARLLTAERDAPALWRAYQGLVRCAIDNTWTVLMPSGRSRGEWLTRNRVEFADPVLAAGLSDGLTARAWLCRANEAFEAARCEHESREHLARAWTFLMNCPGTFLGDPPGGGLGGAILALRAVTAARRGDVNDARRLREELELRFPRRWQGDDFLREALKPQR